MLKDTFQQHQYPLFFFFFPSSVTVFEGTVTSLLEEDGCVTGLQYREKESGEVKVRRGKYVLRDYLTHPPARRDVCERVCVCRRKSTQR